MNWKGKSKAVDGWYRFCYIALVPFVYTFILLTCTDPMPLFFQRSGPECALLTKSNKAWGCGSIRKHLCVTMQTVMSKESSKYPVSRPVKESLLHGDGSIISTLFQANGHRQTSRKPTAFGPKNNPIQQRFEEKWLWLPLLTSREHWTTAV